MPPRKNCLRCWAVCISRSNDFTRNRPAKFMVGKGMKLSRSAAYGLQAILQIARIDSSEPIPCNRIAVEGEMPERFLLQVLRNLVTAGILQSTRGADGGYALDRDSSDISLLQVIEAVDGTLDVQLPMTDVMPPTWHTRIQSVLSDVTAITRQQLDDIKINQLLPPPPMTEPPV